VSVNYLIEIIGLDDWELTHPIPATAYKLLRKLQYLANKERFPERISVSNGLLMSMIGCSEDSLIKARNWLIQQGLITYKGQKKLTPMYSLRYFSHNPVYNSKIAGYEQGIKQGIEPGIKLGNERGIKQGTYLNERIRETGSVDEDVSSGSTEATPEDLSPGFTPLRYRTPPDNRLWETAQARALNVDEREIDRVFPLRTRKLTESEYGSLEAAQSFLANPGVSEVFAARRNVVDRVLASDRFPLALVALAIDKTELRHRRYTLDNPVAYMLQLLFDWEERGIKTIRELQESMDDWRDGALAAMH
jgi:hypothetical protein